MGLPRKICGNPDRHHRRACRGRIRCPCKIKKINYYICRIKSSSGAIWWPARLRSCMPAWIILCLATCMPKASGQVMKDIGDLVNTRDINAVAEPELGKLYLPLLPIISYAPANGFMLGVGIA